MAIALTQKEAYSRFKEKGYKLLGSYSNYNTRVKLKHSKCKSVVYMSLCEVKNQYMCPNCRKIKSIEYNKNRKDFYKKCEALGLKIKYYNNKEDHAFECIKCGIAINKEPTIENKVCTACKNKKKFTKACKKAGVKISYFRCLSDCAYKCKVCGTNMYGFPYGNCLCAKCFRSEATKKHTIN